MAIATGRRKSGQRRPTRTLPRRNSARSHAKGRIHWDKLGRTVLVVAIVAIVASYFQPLTSYFQQRSAAKKDEVALRALERENARLRLGIREQTDPLTLQVHARKLGMVRADERPYIIRNQ